MDSRVTRAASQVDPYFEQFCDRIFALPWLSDAIKLFTCERNTGHEAGRLAAAFLRRRNVCCIRMREGLDYGWITGGGGTSKNKYMEAVVHALNLDQVVYMQDAVVTMAPGDTKSMDERREEVFNEFEAQLARMQPIVDEATTAFGRTRVGISGKTDPEGKVVPGINDDLAMSYAMNLYIVHQLFNNKVPTFEPFLRERIVRGSFGGFGARVQHPDVRL